ncbi:alpha/beta fold hydrolase [Nocardioides caldifontis]|uniref:alpha/beta fold hydrolase n=1 Tax=Nocardioides caldifontis TaxID=2588938 RepID=UPI001EF08316|nr:alpha/beta fold hydrolase [Nocardioides caldifontis]
MSGAQERADRPLLVLGPSSGTSATTLWGRCAGLLAGAFDVLAWDLPGHGYNRAVPDEGYTMAELAGAVLSVVDDVQAQRGDGGGTFHYAGDSVGGAVGLQLLLDVPGRVEAAVLLCTGARLGTAESWRERMELVARTGTAGLVESSAQRWFAPGFLERDPETCTALLQALQAADDRGYAQVCQALASFDVRDRLGEIGAPVLAVAGADDPVTPPELLRALADGVRRGRLVVLDGTGHLPPAETPAEVAGLLREHLLGEPTAGRPVEGNALPGLDAFLADHARGATSARPGLDPRSRSLVSLAALATGGQRDELVAGVREALRHGVTAEEVVELLREVAVHSGVPAANAAYHAVRPVLDEAGG